MPYSPNHKQDTRRRILRSAARLFNRRGFSEATIDEIMTAAGLTHGGFYRHFSSKDKLYAEAVRHFLCNDAPEPWQRAPADVRKTGRPFARFIVDAYLSHDHLDDRDGSCPLIGLPSDVARSSKVVKAAYREVAESMIGVFEANLNRPKARERALVLIALCVGGMVLARAMDNQALADDLRKAAHKHVLVTAGWGDGRGH
jgi:TetR/AcrR family transcriptional regulator, transcriptional repressor for nem operon